MHDEAAGGYGRGLDRSPALPGAARRVSAMHVLCTIVDRASAVLGRITAILSIALTIGFLFCLLLQITMRYVFSAPLAWTEEVAVLLFVWTMLLLASLGVRERFHVRLDLAPMLLPAGLGRARLEMLLTLGIGAFGAVLAVTGLRLVDLVWGNTSAAVQYPMQLLYFAAPVSGALIVIHAVANLVNAWRGRHSR